MFLEWSCACESTLPVRGATSSTTTATILGVFQSTLPVRGATRSRYGTQRKYCISIHAPRGGSDGMRSYNFTAKDDFNPRSPWGERRYTNCPNARSQTFQSTLPVGGATIKVAGAGWVIKISIHAPRGGSDVQYARVLVPVRYFNPRSPWGERRYIDIDSIDLLYISIHAPRGGSDRDLHQRK